MPEEKKQISVFAMRNFIAIFFVLIIIGGFIGRGCDFDFSFGFCGGVDIDKDELASPAQLALVNTVGVNNKYNRDLREEIAGCKRPSWYKEFHKKGLHRPWLLFINATATDNYDDFEERVLTFFQPKDEVCTEDMSDSECEEMRTTCSAIYLSQSAIGAYQILLEHHGKHDDDWDHPGGDKTEWKQNWEDDKIDWEDNLEFIQEFITDQKLQIKIANGVIVDYCKQSDGDPHQTSSHYYSGNPTKWYRVGDWMPQAGGHGSKRGYSSRGGKCFVRKTKSEVMDCASEEHINIMRKCIHSIESGGKKGRNNKYKMNKQLFLKWDKRGVPFDLDDINDYEPPNFD